MLQEPLLSTTTDNPTNTNPHIFHEKQKSSQLITSTKIASMNMNNVETIKLPKLAYTNERTAHQSIARFFQWLFACAAVILTLTTIIVAATVGLDTVILFVLAIVVIILVIAAFACKSYAKPVWKIHTTKDFVELPVHRAPLIKENISIQEIVEQGECIGSGSFGTAYKTQGKHDNRWYVYKIMRDQPSHDIPNDLTSLNKEHCHPQRIAYKANATNKPLSDHEKFKAIETNDGVIVLKSPYEKGVDYCKDMESYNSEDGYYHYIPNTDQQMLDAFATGNIKVATHDDNDHKISADTVYQRPLSYYEGDENYTVKIVDFDYVVTGPAKNATSKEISDFFSVNQQQRRLSVGSYSIWSRFEEIKSSLARRVQLREMQRQRVHEY